MTTPNITGRIYDFDEQKASISFLINIVVQTWRRGQFWFVYFKHQKTGKLNQFPIKKAVSYLIKVFIPEEFCFVSQLFQLVIILINQDALDFVQYLGQLNHGVMQKLRVSTHGVSDNFAYKTHLSTPRRIGDVYNYVALSPIAS